MVRISKEALHASMTATGIGTLQLAYLTKMHDSTISRLLNHGGNAHYATAFNLANALGVSPFDLVEGTGSAGDDDRHNKHYRAGNRKGVK